MLVVLCRSSLVRVLARCFSASPGEIGLLKCELSRCIAVSDDLRRGIGNWAEFGLQGGTGGPSSFTVDGSVEEGLEEVGGDIEKQSRLGLP